MFHGRDILLIAERDVTVKEGVQREFYMSREETTQPQEPVYRFYERSVSTDGC